MRQVFAIFLGCIAVLAGLYLALDQAAAAEQSVMQPYVATPDDITHARALTKQYYAQKAPPTKMRTWSQQSLVRPSAWSVIKHDNPQSLGDGNVMQLVYPKKGVACVVIRNTQTASIVSSDCGNTIPGASR